MGHVERQAVSPPLGVGRRLGDVGHMSGLTVARRKIQIVLVLSIVWAVGGGLYTRHNDIERAESSVKWTYKVCTDTKALQNDPDLSSCEAERAKTRAIWMEGSTKGVLFVALAPLPFFWLS